MKLKDLKVRSLGFDGLMVENLQLLKDVSGWDVLRVDGVDVKMVFKGDIYVSFNVNELARGGSAKVDVIGSPDAVQQFTYSALSPSTLKGDVQTVHLPLSLSNSRF
jgi:hypothetical protein